MKKILFFLINFTIFSINYACAYDSQCYEDFALTAPNYKVYNLDTHVGHFSSSSAAGTAMAAYFGGSYQGILTKWQQCDENTTYHGTGVLYKITMTHRDADNWEHYDIVYASFNTQYVPVIDSDGDGIPDDQDIYPDDSTPYSVRLISYQTVDGSYSGEHIRECYETDRGDTYCIGEDFDPDAVCFLEFNGTWQDPADTPIGGSDGMSDKDPDEGLQQDPFTAAPPTGDVPASNDPSFEDGTPSTGSETDNEALRGIMDNTDAIASNTSRQGDYLKELTKSMQNIDRNIASDISDRESKKAQDEAEAEQYKTDFQNYDPVAGLSEVNGNLVEGEDYETPGELADETWVSDFVNNNPLKSVFDNSGFSSSGSFCSATLDLGYLGIHELNICELESGFIAFGNLLVALTTLAGIVHVATGRGI